MSIILSCNAFKEGGAIPPRYTCIGEDHSPALAWSGIPGAAKSLALIVDDPDAPRGWIHWVVYNLPPDTSGLPEKVPEGERLRNGAVQGRNDFHRHGYGGPCPPSGTHRYRFRLYALDCQLSTQPLLTAQGVMERMGGHILDQTMLTGTFHK